MNDVAEEGVPVEGAAQDQIEVTAEALDRWRALESGVPLKLSLSREDLDHLLLGLRSLAIGQNQLVAALTGHINQDMKASAEALLAADQLCVAAYNRINAFITMVMVSATPETGGPAGEGAPVSGDGADPA
ncbi:hypothetical protein V5F53_18760 [Xanthobacter sp. V4C-4]|uniref:hypothetical protein n=1 Tax=Xanthobacter cornucopiae TaxID=3119924 RepID=UPI00372C9853